jgi:putative ABC transport system substrate-binding protein
MKRREFIAGLGGVAAWPLAARAQQADRVRRIGWLLPIPIDESPAISAIRQRLAELGWTEGRNLRIDFRGNARTAEQARTFAKELVDLQPDVLVTTLVFVTKAVQQQTRTIPIVFIGAGDPLSTGLVASLSRPEGNTTGVTDIFPTISGKWLELLKGCVPGLARVALIFNPNVAIGIDQVATPAAQAGAQYGVRTIKTPVRNIDEIERAIAAFAAEPDGGLIMMPPPLLAPERQLINRLAVRYRLPMIYQDRSYAVEGGLLSYGSDFKDMYPLAAAYIDRILRGAKPGDLPIQFPTKFHLAINLKTAKAMGLTISESFLNLADEIIE